MTKTPRKRAKPAKVARKRVSRVVPRAAAPAPTTAAPKAVRAGSKTEVVRALLLQSGGTTTAQILTATGWPTVSVPALAASCGLDLRKEKVKGAPTKYYGTEKTASAA